MSYNREKFTQKQQETLKKALEAGKKGKVLTEINEQGEKVNPYIPLFISKAPWYAAKDKVVESLDHQRIEEKKTSDSSAHHKRYLSTQKANVYRKGACENCGSLTHKKRDCLERPRKKGAKYTAANIQPDEFLEEADLDFEGKRDRWASYNASEYQQVIADWQKIEAEKEEILSKCKDESGSSSSDSDDEDDERYAEGLAQPGQKVNMKSRMTQRNLRLREDTVKYLRNLDEDASLYHPKSRAMHTLVDKEEDSFTKQDPDHKFAWDSGSSSRKALRGGKERILEDPNDEDL